MPIKAFTLLDDMKIPWIAFDIDTTLYQKPCIDQCRLALSVEFNHLDVAQMYGNEDGVGEAISSFLSSENPRESLYVTTKLSAIPVEQIVEDTLKESLRKLKTTYVDLFLVHIPTQHLQREGGLKQVWREMVEVKKKGLMKSIDVSNFNKAYLEEAISTRLEKPTVNQIEYHLLVATKLAPLLAYMQVQGIHVASYGSLSSLLPQRTSNESIKPVLLKLTSTLNALIKTRGSSITQNQILFKWLEKQQVIAITTSSRESRLKEYLSVNSLSKLTDDEMKAIQDVVGGAHYRCFPSFKHMDDN